MSLDVLENVFMLLAAIIGLLSSLFRYMDDPGRGWFGSTAFFLLHLLSGYYWTIYSLVIQDSPNVYPGLAYLGWNLGYVVLLFLVIDAREKDAASFFHPLILLPIPVNILQVMLYLQFGGILNSLWQGFITTAIACVSMQSIVYYLKNRKAGAKLPYYSIALLLFIMTEYGMWTSSCFSFDNELKNPYYYFAAADYVLLMFLPWALGRDYEASGNIPPLKNTEEIKFNVLTQMITSFAIFGFCIGGYYLAIRMRDSVPMDAAGSYDNIAVTLFIISLVLVGLILGLILFIGRRYRKAEKDLEGTGEIRRSRLNLIFTIAVTLLLMIFSVTYTSRLFYRISVTDALTSGSEKAEATSNEIENYLSVAFSTLRVTADTVDIMVKNGDTKEKIDYYLTYSTAVQSQQFDESFTGLYAYLHGEYMDGSGWIPPSGYDAETRDWYISAVRAGGETVFVPPYVDANTGSMVITIAKMISGGKDGHQNVVAQDVLLDHIQEITEEADLSGKGYGMVINHDGLIISHSDPTLTGHSLQDILGEDVFQSILETGQGTLHTESEGEKYTFFIDDVMDQWYSIIAIGDSELYEDVYSQLFVNIAVSLIIFSLISFFFFLGYQNERSYDRLMENMRISRQKQEFRSQMLELEKAAADEANKAKSSFLADMSHEIRTPINAILGMNEMISREAHDKSIREYSNNIGISGKNLLQLINSILDFSKIESGKMEIVPARYSLKSLISYLLNSILESARLKGLRLIFDIDPGLPSELYGDDSRIGQIFMNLLTNAVKYTEKGSVTLSLKEAGRNDGRVLLRAEVKDTGIGIRGSDKDKFLQSFERLDVEKNRNIEGTGLGMSITTNLLSLMDSELEIESTYGEGSVFSFYLWQGIENPSPLGDFTLLPQDTGKAGQSKPALRAPTARILVADDTKMNLEVAKHLLKRTEVQVDAVLSGEEAYKYSILIPYDLILLDQRMPGMDGIETLKAIRGEAGSPNLTTPVICLTADAISGARERYLSEGFTDYLSKPVSGRTLEQALASYLPKDKIRFAEDTEETVAEDTDGNAEDSSEETPGFISALKDAGIDTDAGLELFENDEDVYREMLSEFLQDSLSRKDMLNKYLDDRDYKNYTVAIHSLKSSARTIGASTLSLAAEELEKASREEDISFIEKKHPAAMELYEQTVNLVSSALQ